MSLLDLTVVPKDERGWALWTQANRTENARIRAAILQQKGVNLFEFQLDPLNPTAVDQYLDNNAQAHSDFNGALGLQGGDLRDVKFSDPEQLALWIDANYQEVYSAEQALRI